MAGEPDAHSQPCVRHEEGGEGEDSGDSKRTADCPSSLFLSLSLSLSLARLFLLHTARGGSVPLRYARALCARPPQSSAGARQSERASERERKKKFGSLSPSLSLRPSPCAYHIVHERLPRLRAGVEVIACERHGGAACGGSRELAAAESAETRGAERGREPNAADLAPKISSLPLPPLLLLLLLLLLLFLSADFHAAAVCAV